MKKIILLAVVYLLVFSAANARQQFSEECTKQFQDLVYNKLIEEKKHTVYHQIWWWVPAKILQGETQFSCTECAEKSGVKNNGSTDIEALSMACSDLKTYSADLIKTFECPGRTL